MVDDFLQKEYFALVDTVREFDRLLFTVKGWGVTVSLAGLGLGFQSQHYGLFLIAGLGGLAFWIIEGLLKRYQMRYYVRMREIEVRLAEEKLTIPRPLIDWSWTLAGAYLSGNRTGLLPPPERYAKLRFYRDSWILPQVFLPHMITVVVGGILFVIGVLGGMGMRP